jgi:alkylhydroperoxidase family enzyme
MLRAGNGMARIKLKEDHELSEATLAAAKSIEAGGGDTSTLRGLANRQDMFDAYFGFYFPARQGKTVSATLIELVRLRIARHNDCFTWLNARLLQDAGHDLTEDKISQLDLDKSLSSFSDSEQLALEYTDRMATDHHNMGDEFFDRLKKHYSDEQILELGMMIGQFIGFGRLLMVLDLESKFCPVEP